MKPITKKGNLTIANNKLNIIAAISFGIIDD